MNKSKITKKRKKRRIKMRKKLLCINVITIVLILMASTAFAAKLTILTNIECESLEVTAGNEVDVTDTKVVDVNGAVTNAGTLTMLGTSELECSGTFTNTSTVTANSSKLTFDGAATQSIIGGGASLYDAVFSTGGKSIDGDLTITYTLTSGQAVTIAADKTLTLAAASVATISAGSWTVDGTLSANAASEIVYISGSAQNVIPANHGKLTHNGDGTLSLTAPLTCGGLLTNTKGGFTAGAHGLAAPGIVWTAGSVTATPSGIWDIGTDGVDVNGGTFVATSHVDGLQCAGNWDMTGATAFTPGTGKVDFDGTGAQTIKSVAKPFYSVDISNTSAAVSMGDKFEFNAAGTLTIDGSATFALAGYEFDDKGTITNGGTFQLDGDETITDGSLSISGDAKFVGTGGTTLTTDLNGLENIEFASAGGNTYTLSEDMDYITGSITFTENTTFAGAYIMEVDAGQTVTNNATTSFGAGTFKAAGTATFAVNGIIFNNLSCTTASAILIFEATKTYEVDGVLTLTGETGTEIDLKSSSGASQFTIQNDGNAESVSYVKVTDCAATVNDIVATNSWAVSNVSGWNFGAILFTSIGDGNWNVAGTWNKGRVPTSSDDAKVSHTVTLVTSPTINALTIDADKSLACGTNTIIVSGTSDINGTATISTGTYDANGSFDAAGGTITFSDAGTLELASTVTSLGTLSSDHGTVDYNGAGQTVFSDTYYNLTLSGSDTKTLGGAITTAGNLTIGSGATLDVSGSYFAISVAGNWANSGTFTPQSGTVTLTGNGSADQTITTNDENFYNLTLNNDEETHVKAVISGLLDVDNDLILTDGTLDLITSDPDPNVNIGNDLTIASGAVWTKGTGTTTFYGADCSLTDNNGSPNNLGKIKVD